MPGTKGKTPHFIILKGLSNKRNWIILEAIG